LIDIAKTLVTEENKMYIAKMFREILDQVAKFDTEKKNVESEITYSIL